MKAKLNKSSKKWIIIASVAAAVCAIGCGVWYYLGHNNSDPVYVFPFSHIGMTEYWGDSQESYGPVTTDKIQTIFLSDTQTVTEVKVKEGDTVKKGDLLMTFDTTLSDLALERKRLEVEKLKLQLDEAKKQLREINSMKPMEVPEFTPGPIGPDAGYELNVPYDAPTNSDFDGSSIEKSMICWIRDDTTVGRDLWEELRGLAEQYQNHNAQNSSPSSASAPGEEEELTEPELTEPEITEPVETEPVETEPVETDPIETEPEETEPTETEPEETEEPEPTETEPEETEETEPTETEPEETEETEPTETEPEETEPTEPYEPFEVNDYYVVMKMTQGNMSGGNIVTWLGFHVRMHSDGSFSFNFYDASMVPDHTLTEDGGGDFVGMPDIDFGSGMTAAQIAQMRSEQEKKIKDLNFQIKMADADYKIMQTEVSDGNIYANIDGTVISLLPEEEAKMQQQPFMKVSGGGGFYIEGSVNELDKELLQIGQEVTVNDWRGGGTYTGTVQSIGDFPFMGDYWNGMGNPNASYYPFLVFVDESADLQAGNYVSVTYSAGTSQNGVYLEKPFLRTENGKSYVMVRGADGRLEQRFVTTGKSLWGSYIEILSGLTEEDMIAFPYGKNIKPGVPVQEGDRSNLYE